MNLEGEFMGILSFDKIKNKFFWSKKNEDKINLNNPYAITIVNDNLYIADKNNKKIQILSFENFY